MQAFAKEHKHLVRMKFWSLFSRQDESISGAVKCLQALFLSKYFVNAGNKTIPGL